MSKKQLKWRFTYTPTGDIVKGDQLAHVLTHLGEVLSGSFKKESEGAYERSRDLLMDRWGISPFVSDDTAVNMLTEKGLFVIWRKMPNHKMSYAHKAQGKIRNGAIQVRLPNVNMQFTIPNRAFLYDMLKANLYPSLQPTEKTFRFQLLSWCTLNSDSSLTSEQILDLLISRRIITLEEIIYNG